MHALLLSVLLTVLGQGSPPTHQLRVGTSVKDDGSGATVRFVEVASDSRCPKGVRCIQAGAAVIRLGVRASGEEVVRTLRVPPGGGAREMVAGVTVEIVRLDPEAKADVEIPAREYVLTLRVSR